MIQPPTCAACLRPIASRQDLVVSGFEVMHKACARLGMQTELARVRECLASANADRARALREKTSAEENVRHQNYKLAELHKRVTRLRVELSNAEIARTRAEQTEAARRIEIAALRAQLDSRSTPEPATQRETEPQIESQREEDGTAVRFSLLELD